MYIEYNVNPKKKKTGDCAIRAVSVASGLSWDAAYKGLAASGFLLKTAMNDVEAVDHFLKSIGFKEAKLRIRKGEKRYKVAEFAEMYPDYYCVHRVANHFVATGRGNYVDIWDSGDMCIYKYWYKEIE